MRDTTPEAARLMQELWAALPGARRLELAAEMFDTARTVVLASLPAELPADETKRRLCERFYGAELAMRYAAAMQRTRIVPQ